MNLEKANQELSGNRICVGLATCGISSGAKPVYEALVGAKLDIPIQKVGCIGMCYNEPLVTVYRDGKKEIYGKVTKDNVDKLIEAIKNNQRLDELFVAEELDELEYYKKQKRVVMENCGDVDPYRLDHYMARGGYSGLKNAVSKTPKEVIEDVKTSGLRGRGGAGFPTGRKWEFICDAKGKKYLICNGDEGDPGAFMNRTLMESDPFKVIEGMTIGSYATGCDEGIIYTRAEYPLAIEILQNAIDLAYKNNLLGKDILGKKGFNFDLKIMKGAGAFVCGEETALIHSIEGKRGQPRPRPPFPAASGLHGRPTSVNNVGSWAHVATIMKMGAEKYAKIGSKKTKGTKIICLTGKIKRTGVVEVPFGISLKEIIYEIGGGAVGGKFKALLSGGPAGGCVSENELNTPLDYEEMHELGTIIGSGGFIIVNEHSCVVNIAEYFMNFSCEESCGRCTPCREGTKRLLELLNKVTRGVATDSDLEIIQELAEFVGETALCGLGQNAPNPVISTLKHFKKEYLMHIKDKKCPAGVCEALISYVINKKCVGCGNCKRHCPVGAITGELKGMHIIDQKKCIKCGACFDNCAFGAINKE